MRLSENLISLIDEMVECGYISKRKHPVYDLYAYKYTKVTQFENKWNEATLLCRGLILDGDYNIVARPMGKFFNYEELPKEEADYIMGSDFQLTEKVDGSLGILIKYNNEYFISTQGSFDSEQAVWASKFLNDNFDRKVLESLDCDNFTYLFEIIYPDNKIIVDYGDKTSLVFLAKINKESGEDLLFSDDLMKEMSAFEITKRFTDLESLDYKKIKSLDLSNKEGFVVHSSRGRLKIKFENYFEKVKIKMYMNPKGVWEVMMEGNVDAVRKELPEELLDWYNSTVLEFESKVENRVLELKALHKRLVLSLPEMYSRKMFAIEVNKMLSNVKGYMFSIEDGRDIRMNVLKELKPNSEEE